MSSGAYIELVAPDDDDAVDFLFLLTTVLMVVTSVLDRIDPGERDFLLRLPMIFVLVPAVVGGGVGVVIRIADRSSATRERPARRAALLRRCEGRSAKLISGN
jgi:hypothetical protein